MVPTPEFTLDKSRIEELIKEPISEFSVSVGCKEGDGVASTLKAIHVKTQNGQDVHLIYKTLDSMDPQQIEFSEKFGIFKTENLVYDTLFPWIEDLGLGTPLPVPKFYGGQGSKSDVAEKYVCVEDLRPQGFQMKDKYQGLNFEETTLVMIKLAEFHAQTYYLLKWKGEQIFDTKLQSLNEMHSRVNEAGPMFSMAMMNAINVIEKRNPVLGSKMKILGETSDFKTVFATCFKTDSEFFPVIIHGDLWSNNIMIKSDASGCPTDLKFIDFQASRRGNIFEDLQYFFFTSTTPDFRRKHLYQVLNSYFESFQATVEKLKCPLPINFTRGFLMDNFRNCYISAFRYMVFAIPLQLGTPQSEVEKLVAVAMQEAKDQSGNNGVATSNGQTGQNKSEIQDEEAGMFDPTAMILGFRLALETSPRAMDRLESIAQELVDYKFI